MTASRLHPPLELHDVFSFVFIREHPAAAQLSEAIDHRLATRFSSTAEWTDADNTLSASLEAAERAEIPRIDDLRRFHDFASERRMNVHFIEGRSDATLRFIERTLASAGVARRSLRRIVYVSTPPWVQQLAVLLDLEHFYEVAALTLALERAGVRVVARHTLLLDGEALDTEYCTSAYMAQLRSIGSYLPSVLADLRIACRARGVTARDSRASTLSRATPLASLRRPLAPHAPSADAFYPWVH